MTYKPTDAELDALRQADNGELNFVTLRQFRVIARAALAKWGSPVVAGEPWGASVGDRVWVGKLPTHVPKLAEEEGLPIQWLYTTPQPTQAQAVPAYPPLPEADKVMTPSHSEPYALWGLRKLMDYAKAYHAAQAQAGAVPLTEAQIDDMHSEANRGYCIELEHYTKAVRDTERAHGITHKEGGQHE